jgi:asparagine synthase (glutamine-hydrolysing)
MTYARGSLVITFNGEIYNFRELRNELQHFDYRFRSDTDTEVILAAVHKWGMHKTLEKLVGMFAFAIWDNSRRVLHLARDRFGEKPMFFSCKDGILYFASELKSLLQIPVLRAGLCMESLWTYLKLGYVCEPMSMIEGIVKLPAAHYLTLEYGSQGSVEVSTRCSNDNVPQANCVFPRKYWSLQKPDDVGHGSPRHELPETLDRLDQLFREAITGQMQCDVPYGVFLSGGFDSTLVTAYLQSQSAHPVHSFTVRFDDPDFDEGNHAARIANYLGTDHHELWLNENKILTQVPELSRVLDEPTVNASVFAARLIAGLAREHVKVCLSGDGGDEGFAGYNRYLLMHNIWNRVKHVPAPVRQMIAAGLSIPAQGFWNWLDNVSHFRVARSGQSNLYRKAVKLQNILTAGNIVQAYESLVSVCQEPETLLNGTTAMDLCWPEPDGSDMLAELVEWDILTYLPGDNLAKLDRASMSTSLEMRLPLLDHRIMEFGYGLPSAFKIHAGETKWLLKQLLFRQVPQDMMTRPKMGFSAPVQKWLQGPLREWSMDLLSDSSMARDGYFNRGAIDKKLKRFSSLGSEANQIWALCILHSWYEGIVR